MKRFPFFVILWAIFSPLALIALWHRHKQNQRLRAWSGRVRRSARHSQARLRIEP